MNDRNSPVRRRSRRSVLAAGGALSAVGLAGCSGLLTAAEGERADVAASFFTFFDFARTITAETPVTVENLVPVGMHGHGWEPDASVTRAIIDADVFVHVGEGFQPWADRAIRTAKDDGADTAFVNVRDGIELLDVAASLDEDEAVADGKDPHFWLDPLRSKTAVDNVEAGLAAAYPNHAETFAANADALRSELDVIHEEYRAVFADPPRDQVVLAAHNAFQYLGARYDVAMNPLVFNLAAEGDVPPEAITRAARLVAENDIEYIAAAVFESHRPARQLIEETRVKQYYPVTPYAGTLEQWVERGWGYAEIARRINMPTFEIVLGKTPPAETVHADYDGGTESL
ncbi:metal ABC transporter substrate-binding protein [Halorientalis halophila]|uniref:metal ABC transporter substrate-binding protein n=1 Tax=Halorientalis halophila TaxID=3108499 RepID=UPI00300BF345